MKSKLCLLALLPIAFAPILQAERQGTASEAAQVLVPASSKPAFSDPPTDAEILACGILPQPLAPMSVRANAAENRALVSALIQYQDSQRAGALRDAVGPLTDFLRAYPASR